MIRPASRGLKWAIILLWPLGLALGLALGQECPRQTMNDNFQVDFGELVKSYEALEAREDISAFEARHPYYIKYCAESRYSKIDKRSEKEREHGTPREYGSDTGHFVSFLKGVCPDREFPNRKIRLCDEEDSRKGEDGGVGISINRPFVNANFVAVPREFFFNGDLRPDMTMDEEKYQGMLKKAEKLYEGIDFHLRYTMPPKTVKKKGHRENFFRELIGSDYGLSLNRYSYCLNVPLNRELMHEAVDFFNQANIKHNPALASSPEQQKDQQERCSPAKAEKGKNYRWNPLRDNCAHLGANFASHLGIVPERPVNRGFLWHLLHLTIPANVLTELAFKTNEEEIGPRRIFMDKKKRDTFLKYDWIPNQPDSLLEIISPTKLVSNEVYQPIPEITAFRKKYTNPYTVKGVRRSFFKTMFSEKRFVKLKENHQFFREKYLRAKVELREMLREKWPRQRLEEVRHFGEKFGAYLDAKLAELGPE